MSYSLGYGPRTRAWLLKPAEATGPLPGVLALHGHDGFKYYGKEKITDGPSRPRPWSPPCARFTTRAGRSPATLPGRGSSCSCPTCSAGQPPLPAPRDATPATAPGRGHDRDRAARPRARHSPAEVARYNAAAWHHEHLLEKYCALLATTLAAVVVREDRIALNYLRGRPDTTQHTGSVGAAGGGCRSALLRATSDHLTAAVVVGMMISYDALLDQNVTDHTWMLPPAGLARHADWPDLAACHAPAPLLVQYNRDDDLFPLPGARAAHERITAHYAADGGSGGYTGQFYDGPHKFDLAMQRAAFTWLHGHLHPPSDTTTP